VSSGTYLRFALDNRRFLGFGFFIALSSSFGQTYFIGVFGPALQEEFSLSHSAWGTVYMAGTLASALLLPWTGKLLDRLDLRHYTTAVCVLFVVACAVTAAATGPLTLVVAIFLLRQSGQGLLSHVALTSMARYFDAGRGRAIAIASLGFAAGEAVLPFSAVLLVTVVGWRETYMIIAVSMALGVAPLSLWLLRGHGERHSAHERRLRDVAGGPGAPAQRSWTRDEVLRDVRFWLLLPAVLSPSLIVTAMFFHHLNLADAKGWSHAWITGNYVLYAAATVATALVVGPLVDRVGALRVLPALLLPLSLALVAVAAIDGAWVVWPYLLLLGLSSGLTQTLLTAMWAELYGVMWLGSVKSLVTALRVFSSALGPVSAGVLMDAGLSLEIVCLGYVGLAGGATGLMLAALGEQAGAASP
jgi:MFS family permease